MTINEFFVWLASSAGAAAFFSFIAQRIPALDNLSPAQKSYLHLVGSVTIALAAWAVLTYVPPDVLDQLAAPFRVLYGVIIAWLANQIAHRADPAT